MLVVARIKENGKLIGYVLQSNKNKMFVEVENTHKYKVSNADRLKSGEWKARKGFSIQTIDRAIIKKRNTSVGKPGALYTMSNSKLSLTQNKLLNILGSNNYIIIDKRKENIKINMHDLSALTAVTGVEYALFERNDKYIVFKGSDKEVCFNDNQLDLILNGRYEWVGHTHPGNSYNCLIPSDDDYKMLEVLHQKRSVIYNSIGRYYVFGEGE